MARETLAPNNLELAQLTLNQTEPSLREFIESHSLASMLSSEEDFWNQSERKANLHPDPDNYQFEKHNKDLWPSRSIRWQGQNNLYYLMQIYLAEDLSEFNFWSVVSSRPFGFPEPGSFQQNQSIGALLRTMPLNEETFTELLDTNYQLLQQEGTKIITPAKPK